MNTPRENRIWTIVRQAYETAKTQRQLWLFGLFAAGAGGVNLKTPGGTAPDWVIYAVIAASIVGVLALLLHLISEGALIHGTAHSRDGGRTSLGVGFRTGLKFAPRVAGIKLLTWLATLLSVVVIAAPLGIAALAGASLLAGGVASVVLAVASVPLLLTIHLLGTYALRAAVLEGSGVAQSLRTARQFLVGRIVPSLWLLIAQALGSSVASLASLVIVLPILALGFALYFAIGLVPAVIIGAILMIPVAISVSGAVGTYRSSLWTHLYLSERIERA
ncbi:MAG: hypothetical protein H6718_04825 [Polyangiaceae bacterium]|nr:hypothetical protein [Polyangiaceae bacterium]